MSSFRNVLDGEPVPRDRLPIDRDVGEVSRVTRSA
jgi:hypothetical protein